MAHKKRRVRQHVMEDKSRQIIRDILPDEWVVRDYDKPDYGIDIAVEVFDKIDDFGHIAETACEWFFAQVKSTEHAEITTHKVYPRYNVEKRRLTDNRKTQAGCLEIPVISYKIDTDTLLTVQSLGSGVPVLLLLVVLDTGNVYFVCLNDLIDKFIIPSDTSFFEKQSKTIYVPATNRIANTPESLIPIRFLAKRMKLYSAFGKFSYQENEVKRLLESVQRCLSSESRNFAAIDELLHFVQIVKRYDFWETTDMWATIGNVYNEILLIEKILTTIKNSGGVSVDALAEACSELPIPNRKKTEDLDRSLLAWIIMTRIQSTWEHLRTLNNIYEECCREWFLPTYFARLTSSAC